MKVRVAVAQALMAAGGLMVTGAALVGFGGAWLESRDRAQLEARLETAGPATELTPAAEVSAPARDLGILRLDRLGWSVVIRPSDSEYDLSRGVGWIRGTALPGADGNSAIAGHRDTYFRVLRHVKRGDTFRLKTEHGVRTYVVQKTLIVNPDDVAVLQPDSRSALTLVTCYPFDLIGHAPQRFIVKAAMKKGP